MKVLVFTRTPSAFAGLAVQKGKKAFRIEVLPMAGVRDAIPASANEALVYLDLVANAYGLGCCWAGILMGAMGAYKPLEEALQLPAGHKACGALMLGYPQSRYHLVPQRNQVQVTWR